MLDMLGHIDDTFESTTSTRTAKTGGEYIDGKWVEGTTNDSPHSINIQPMSMKQIAALQIGGERISDYRNVWVNDGVMAEISEADTWVLDGIDGTFKTTQLDNRPWRNYCKFVAVRIDPS